MDGNSKPYSPKKCLGEWWFTMVETIKDHQQKHIQVQDWTHQPLTCKSMLQKTPVTSQHVRQEEVIEMSSPTFTYDRNAKGNTVDERSPAPPGIHKTLQIMGWTTNLNWLAGFLPSTSYVLSNAPTWIHPKFPFKQGSNQSFFTAGKNDHVLFCVSN